MKFKKSIYNTLLETRPDGKILVFNTASGILSLLDQQTQKLYNEVESIQYEDLDSDSKDRFNKLILASYVVDKDIDEISVIKVRRQIQKYQTDYLNLTIAPTLGCNMACPYCYERKNDYIMNESTQNSIITFVKSIYSSSPFKALNVTWYGGEPLFAKDVLLSLSTKLISICNEMCIDYTSSMITNGTLFDYATAKQLADHHKLKSVQITIDGMKKTHNLRRRLVDNSDSFSKIINNIENVKDFVNIIIRVNVDKSNLNELPIMIDYFLNQLKWGKNPKVYFAPVVNYTSSCKTESSVCITSKDFADLEFDLAKRLYKIDRSAIIERLFPKPITISCGAETKNNYLIDPKGYLYHCWLHIGNQQHRSGHVDSPHRISKEDAKWLLADLNEKCYECKFIPICQGGCAYHRICNNETYHCTRSSFNYKEMLQLACEDYLLHKSE